MPSPAWSGSGWGYNTGCDHFGSRSDGRRTDSSPPHRRCPRVGYKRSKFKHWIDAGKDGCNARQEVLIEEATEEPKVGPGCFLTDGEWFSYDDAKTTDNPRSLDIDHMVPLAEAWDSK
ncbi:hypothetical protein [Streptomyces sp. 891-h]|uniref:hypothetical protein n=1 Tax=Streptomyces sp. 891-h TaxID=2720714 RepID=UPI001FAAD400|nr:hypothetical protein [Streptomyces sp. 891-h]UNZ21337.1 hypothetical protein HC362_34065 [Streptomyces sp. 891-h]